jgi:hypothetical protein
MAGARPESAVDPLGPGKVFETVEAAAIDGLAYARKVSMKSRNARLSRGGTIYSVENGYAHGRLVSARAEAPDQLRVKLGKAAVAHFHTYPAQYGLLDRRNETHSRADRAIVDVYDSKHRPSFVLTPSLRIMVYRGEANDDAGEPQDQFVASLTQPLADQMLAGR